MQGEAKINEHRLKKRYMFLLMFFLFCFSVLSVRLFVLQVLKHEEYLAKAKNNIESETALKADRGIIYDRNMVALAVNVTKWRVYISPCDIKSEEEAKAVAAGMAKIFGIDYESLLTGSMNRTVRDKTIKNKASEEEKTQVIDYALENGLSHCIHTEADTARYYPYGSLAASVIGFVGTDGGLFGVENYYDAYLKGEDGKYITYKNASGESLPNSASTYIKAKNGSDIVLTIDITLQAMLEAQLKEAYIDANAQNKVTGVVTDPTTGEILAMATYPNFDLNSPYVLNEYYQSKLAATGYVEGSAEYKKAKNNYLYEMWNNKAVSTLYEPGSTFKIITTAVALEENVTTVNEGFFCSGALKIDGYGTPIRCHKRQGHGSLNFAQALQKSCNPTMIKLAQRIGSKKFMQYFKAFGYTEKTGVDMPGEALGIFHSEENFNNVELSVYSFGQTFKTTALQQLCAIGTVANGGETITPYVVKEIRGESGKIEYSGASRSESVRVISSEVSRTITDILIEGVSGDGGAKNAGVEGYNIAAKTGTSQKRDIKDKNLYVGSCVAYATYEKANIAAIIVVDEPMCSNYYGSTVAAPYVSAFLSGALPYLGIEPNYTEDEKAKASVTVEDYVGMELAEAKRQIEKLGITVTVVGNGEKVISQTPRADVKLYKDSGRVILYTDGESKSAVVIPNVVGMNATEAMKLLIDAGLNIGIEGVTDYDKGVGATVIGQDKVGVECDIGSVVIIRLRYLDVRE